MARESIEERLSRIEVQRKTLGARLVQQGHKDGTRHKVLLGTPVPRRQLRVKDGGSKDGGRKQIAPRRCNRAI
ncbi:hypothetical protein ACU8OH_35905 (plasmid) [Rhizobium leguminosarum]